MQFKRTFILIALCVLHNVDVMASEVFINKIRASESTYMLDLMKLALSYSPRQYQYVQTKSRLTKDAQNEAALDGTISVFWGGTSPDQEDTYIPVHIDAYRGLMSLRFMIVRGDDVDRFKSVNNLTQLQQFTLGQGRGWKDGKILQAAGFDVAFSSKKTGLYHMLEGGRFDAFPRGATEAWVEAEANKELDLAVEEHLIIRYPLPTYFFVNKQQLQLATDIKAGLLQAIDDGSFDQFFFDSERVQQFLARANLAKRTVIDLDNPFLTQQARESIKYNLSLEDLIAKENRNEMASNRP